MLSCGSKKYIGGSQSASAEGDDSPVRARVFASMYLKSQTPKDGFVPHEAEGKHYFIKPVTEQTFYPGEDSYRSMHHHGMAFESEQMAYRVYFDKKQTIDVYAKRTPRLELEATKWYPNDEQLAQGYGDDILLVSGYIGVGACKPYHGGKMQHFDDVLARKQRITESGKQRVVCEMEDSLWLAPDGNRYDVITRYTICEGHRDVMVDVFLRQGASVPQLCTGVQRIGEPLYGEQVTEQGIALTSWGTAFPVNDTVKYKKETAGLAVFVPKKYALSNTTDKNNNLVLLQLLPLPASSSLAPAHSSDYLHARYFFTVVSLKEQNPPCSNNEQFSAFVKKWTEELGGNITD